ncbi:hypothetical protein C1646_754743 [Rhizophagus diaphanus]|nr:hypothetical protein C1646_754743 [Rhizophagus diaphanus] [Rhizophagus sp. MUCL 43196]
MSTRTLIDFYRETAIEDWTCVNLAEHYHAWSGKKDLKKVLDSMKKDLQKRKLGLLVSSDELFVRRLAQAGTLELDCIDERIKQVNQLATGNDATYNDIRIIPGKHRRDANDDEKMNIEGATTLAKKDEHKDPPIKRTKIDDFFPVHYGIPFKDMKNDCHTDDGDVKSTPSGPSQDYYKDPEYFDKLVDDVDLTYIGGEEEPTPPLPKSRIPVEKSWDSFMIDEIDIAKCFSSLRKSLPKTTHEPTILGVLDLTGQHKPTKKMLWKKWNYLVDDFRVDVGWKMIGLDQSELDFFDNMEDLEVQQTLPILNAHLTILKSSEQQLIASQERRREGQDPNNERARAGQKTDIIIDLPTGPALEGFICEVSGGLPAGCPKKIWTDKLKLMVGMRDMINRIMKTFPGLLSTDYMKVVVFGCQVIGLQMNLYAMDVRTPGIYRFGIVDKVSLPASAKELPTYEAVHVMLRSLEHRLSNLTDYCTDLKVKHAKLRRKHDYIYREDRLAFSNNTPNSSPKNKLPSIRSYMQSEILEEDAPTFFEPLSETDSLKQRINELEAENNIIKAENSELKSRIVKLEDKQSQNELIKNLLFASCDKKRQ